MDTGRRSYADPCGVARALDAVGERWALLVVRELSLGPRRFGHLRAGLPGVSPNVLSQRLRELEDGGVVRRYELDAPAGGAAYELTENGYALDPVLQALGRWGAERPIEAPRAMSAVSLLRAVRTLLVADAPDSVYGIDVGREPFRLEIAAGAATVRRGRPADAVAVLAGDAATLHRALLGGGYRDALASGALTVTGDRRAAARLPRLLVVPEAGRKRAPKGAS